MKIIRIVNSNDVPFTVVARNRDGKFGGQIVEFYDARYPHTQFGQFVSDYYIDTILGEDGYGSGKGGINLYGGVDAWYVDADVMDKVREWLKEARKSL